MKQEESYQSFMRSYYSSFRSKSDWTNLLGTYGFQPLKIGSITKFNPTNYYYATYKLTKKTLLHGSPTDVERLDPHPSKVVNGEKVVFATDERWLALMFVAPSEVTATLEFGYENGIPYIKELNEGDFKGLEAAGYLYTVPANDFVSDSRLGMPWHEVICPHAVEIVVTEKIANARVELEKISELKWIGYSQHSPKGGNYQLTDTTITVSVSEGSDTENSL
jgi:hypothetical protein